MTLRELIDAHPALFYKQTWYEGEPFFEAREADTKRSLPITFEPTGGLAAPPLHYADFKTAPRDFTLVAAATLAKLYVTHVATYGDSFWRRWFWTSDYDRHGQRVYVGVGPDEKGFEIHRHIHITDRFGVAVWR